MIYYKHTAEHFEVKAFLFLQQSDDMDCEFL